MTSFLNHVTGNPKIRDREVVRMHVPYHPVKSQISQRSNKEGDRKNRKCFQTDGRTSGPFFESFRRNDLKIGNKCLEYHSTYCTSQRGHQSYGSCKGHSQIPVA